MKKFISLLCTIALLISLLVSVPVCASGDNLALGKPVTATTEWGGGFLMPHINDGKLSTSWSAGTIRMNPNDSDGNEWIMIDLGAKYDINSIIAYSRADVNQPGERTGWIYQVSETADFAEKTIVGTKKISGAPGEGYEVAPLEPVTGRYVRIASPKYYVIAEVEVYGTPAQEKAKGEYDDIMAEGELYNASQLVYNLGIMDGVSGKDFGINHLITRKEAAKIVALLKNSGTLTKSATSFNDVLPGDEYSGYINWCEQNFIVSKAASFRPDDLITGTEFAAMLLRANGYWEAASFGTYPQNVFTLAQRCDLLDGVDIVMSNPVNRSQVLLMMKNVLLGDIVQSVAVKNGELIYKHGDIYLKETFELELADGVVTQNHVSGLTEPKEFDNEYVYIDGYKFKDTSASVSSYLGERIYYLADADQDNIVGAWKNPDIGKTVTIQCEDIISSDKDEVAYWDEVSGKERKYRFDTPVYFIKNGVASGKYVYSNLKRTNGKIVLIDNDDDGEFEVIKLYEPKVLVIDYIAANDKSIIVGGQNGETFSSEKYEVLSASLNGFPIAVSEIGSGYLAYIYESDNKKYVELEISSASVSGNVTEITDTAVSVDGIEYNISKYYIENKATADNFKVGSDCKFLLDMTGKIVWVVNDEIVTEEETLGVICAVSSTQGAFQQPQIMIYNQNKTLNVFDLADSVVVDGKRYSASGISTLGLDYFECKAVIYKCNSNGLIKYLDTENYDSSVEKSSKLIPQDKWTLPIDSRPGITGFYTTDGSTMVMPRFDDYKVFTIPLDSATKKPITDEMFIGRYSYQDMSSLYPANTTSLTSGEFTFYGEADADSPILALRTVSSSAVRDIAPITAYTSTNILLVDKVGRSLDNKGDESYFVMGYNPKSNTVTKVKLPSAITKVLDSHRIYSAKAENGTVSGISFSGINYVSVASSSEINNYASPILDLNKGDVIRYDVADGYATAIERIYENKSDSVSQTFDGTLMSTGDNYNRAYQAGFRAVTGNIDMLERGILTVGNESFKYNDSDAKYFLYVKDGEIIGETIEMLPLYASEGDRIIFVTLSGKVSYIIVYSS